MKSWHVRCAGLHVWEPCLEKLMQTGKSSKMLHLPSEGLQRQKLVRCEQKGTFLLWDS